MASLKIIISISDKASDKFTKLGKNLNNLDRRMKRLNKEHKQALTDRYNATPMTSRIRGVSNLQRSLKYADVMKRKAFTDDYKPSNMLKRINHVRQYRNGISQTQRLAKAGIKLPISMDKNALRGMQNTFNRMRTMKVPITADTKAFTRQLNNLSPNNRIRVKVPVQLDGAKMRQIERNMSRLRVNKPIRLRAVDEVSPIMQRITGMLARIKRVPTIAIKARDTASNMIKRVSSAAGNLKTSYTTRLNAIDRVTGPISRVSGLARNFAGRTFTATVRIADMATRPLQAIARTATSTLALLGVAGGAYGGVMAPIKMVADRQDVTTQFEVMLGGAEQASKRVEELTTFAGSTPFLRDDIFEASRVLQTFTGDALSTGEGLQLIGDVAAGTKRPINEVAMWFGRLYDGLKSGRPVGDATMALQEMGAMSGETRNMVEDLAESGENIADIWPRVTGEFDQYNGMMEKMSDNMNNLLLGVRSFITNTLMMPWGEGLESAIGPMLQKFREWRGENSKVLEGVRSDLESYGSKFGELLTKPFYGLGSIVDEAFQNDELNGLGERMKYIVSESIESVNQWLQSSGIDKISGFLGDIGETYGGGLNKLINGLMGTSDEGDSSIFTTLGELGRESAIAFGKGFIEQLDPKDLLEKAFGKLKELNIGGGKSLLGHLIGDDELKEQGNIWGTLLVDAMLLAMAAKFLPGFKGILAGVGTLAGGVLAGLFGKSSKKGGKGFGKGGLIGSMFFGKDGKLRKPNFKKMFGGLSGLKNFKLPKGLGKLLTGFKGLPLVGTLLSAFGLITGGAENMGESIGTILGGLGGGALGTLFGPIGTTIGAALGALGGGKIGELFDTGVIQEKWSALSSWFTSSVWEPIKNGATSAGEWISNAWTSSIDWIKNTWSTISTWFMDTVWTPISDFAKESWQTISDIFTEAKTWVQDTWSEVSTWFMDSVWTPLAEFATETWQTITDIFVEAKTWIQDTWSEVSTWFQETIWDPIKNFAIDTLNIIVGLFVMAWQGIQETWATVSEWFVETVWTPLLEWATQTWTSIVEFGQNALLWIQETWATVSEWFMEMVWTPLIEWATTTWNTIVEWSQNAWLWIQETWLLVSEWFIENVWTPLTEWATTTWNSIVLWAQNAWLWIQETWLLVSEWFIEMVWTPLSTWASETWTQISNWASNAWLWIQETWALASTWFIETVWTPLKTWASETWESIKVFFSDALTAIQGIWGTVSEWFSSNVWEPIKNVFSTVSEYFGEKFDAAKERVTGAFAGVAGWFQTNVFGPIQSGLDAISGAVETVAGAVSNLIGKAKSIGSSITGLGGPSGGGAATGSIGAFSTGGYITKRQTALIGENGNEFVIPVERNKDQGRQYLKRAAGMLGMTVMPSHEAMNTADHRTRNVINLDDYRKTRTPQSNQSNKPKVTIPRPPRNNYGGNGNKTVQITFTGDFNVRDDSDIDKIAERVKRSIIEEIDEEYPDGEVM